VIQQFEFPLQAVSGRGHLKQQLLLIGHGAPQMSTNPERQFPWKIRQIVWQGGRVPEQLPRQIHNVLKRLAHLNCQIFKVINDRLVFNPAHQANHERCVPDNVEDSESLLSKRHNVAAIILLGLMLEDFGAAANCCHVFGLGIPSHNPEASISLKHRPQHDAVTVLKNVQWQHFLRKKHHIRQGE